MSARVINDPKEPCFLLPSLLPAGKRTALKLFSSFNPTEGFHCDNSKQSDGVCRDYKVRFGCPCVYGYSSVGVEPDLERNQQPN